MNAIITRCHRFLPLRRQGLVGAASVSGVSTDKVFLSTSGGGTAGFQTVGCVGLGLMGHGICQVAATSGVHSKVIAYEKEQKFLDAGCVKITT
jgi:phosphoglycerate dehydrogenase-like enzyme